MPFQKLIKEIVKFNPGTKLEGALSKGDCGCFDFVGKSIILLKKYCTTNFRTFSHLKCLISSNCIDSTVQISKVDTPDQTAVSDAMDSLPENISSKTISKFASKKPRTLGDALKLISPHLGNAFKDTGLDLPLDISRFNADVQSAARQNGGKLDRYTFIAHLIKNIQPENPIQAFRVLKFFRNIVKHNPYTSKIFSRLIPSKETRKIPACKFIKCQFSFENYKCLNVLSFLYRVIKGSCQGNREIQSRITHC